MGKYSNVENRVDFFKDTISYINIEKKLRISVVPKI